MTVVTIDQSVLLGVMNAKIAASLAQSSQSQTTPSSRTLPQNALPWRQDPADPASVARKILAGSEIVQERADTSDSGRIFSAYDALVRLRALASAVSDRDVQPAFLKHAQGKFTQGLTQLQEFLDANTLEKVILLPAEKLSAAKTDVAIQRTRYRSVTPPVHTGSPDDAVPAFAEVKGFGINVKKASDTVEINVDLSSLDPHARSVRAVANLIDSALDAAGVSTGVEATKTGPPNQYGHPTGNDWGFAIKGVQTEKISFVATDDTNAGLYLAATSGTGKNKAGHLSLWHSLDQTTPTSAFLNLLTPDSGALEVIKTAVSKDGAVYTLAQSHGTLDGQSPRTDHDLILIRSDSTGKRIWSRFLGSQGTVQGTALAVADDGRVAVGGTVAEKLDTASSGGKQDGFVVIYDALGRETLVRQRGVAGNDAVTSLAFGTGGTLHVGGKTTTPLDGSDGSGGASDAYIETLDTDGKRVWIRHLGTDQRDAATALTSDGSAGVILATQDAGDIVLRRFAGGEDDQLDWTHRLGPGRADTILVDGTAVYVSGQTRSGTRTDGVFDASTLDASDGFAVRIDLVRELVEQTTPDSDPSAPTGETDPATEATEETPSADGDAPEATEETPSADGDAPDATETDASEPSGDGDATETASGDSDATETSAGSGDGEAADSPAEPVLVPSGPVIPTEAWFHRIGGDGSQTAPAIGISGERLYVSGTIRGDSSGVRRSYLKALDSSDGSDIWQETLSGRDGVLDVRDIAIDPKGDSSLARLGLPRGEVITGDTERITDRTPARPGDHFYISVNGGRRTKIVIGRGDSYRDLTFRINAATVLDATAKVVTNSDERRLTITPAASAYIELFSGRSGRDALSVLGLPEGKVYGPSPDQGDQSSAGPDIVALGLRLDAEVSGSGTLEMLDTALRRLRTAYRSATEDPALDRLSAGPDTSGPVPAWLQQQLSNYRAGLLRLQSVDTSGLAPLPGSLLV